MKRLTQRDEKGKAEIKYQGTHLLFYLGKCGIDQAIEKLAAYEDTGFTPEEVQQLVDQQKWHVVADGDLPPKRPKRGFLYLYIVTYNYEDDPMITPRTGLAWYDCKGEWIGYNEEIDDFESGDILAWRELPEPWEGVVK